MSQDMRALLIDDDPSALDAVAFALRARFPDLAVECRTIPDGSGDFDVFLVDNDFDGVHLGIELAVRIRAACPNALILAYSGRLDAPLLKGLLNAGCSGAFDKSEPADLQSALDVIAAYQESVCPAPASSGGFLEAARSITALLREWNHRLDADEQEKQEMIG